MSEDIARQLDGILDSYNKRVEERNASGKEEDREKRDSFLAAFERVKVEVIRPVMEEVGKYLESKGQQYQVKDETSLYHGNPKVTLEILPRTPVEGYDLYEMPSISFIGETISMTIGVQKKNGMPGQPGGTVTTEGTRLEEMTADFVRSEIVELIKENFR